MDAEEIKKLSEAARVWVDSEQGKRALRKALRDARETASELEKARRVDPDDLFRPFMI